MALIVKLRKGERLRLNGVEIELSERPGYVLVHTRGVRIERVGRDGATKYAKAPALAGSEGER